MPPGRPLNRDAKIARLIADLRKALVAREAARIEGAVASHINELVASLQSGIHVGGARQAAVVSAAAPTAVPAAASKPKGRKRRSAASRKLQAAKMKAYWAARKAKEGKGKAGKAAPMDKRASTAK